MLKRLRTVAMGDALTPREFMLMLVVGFVLGAGLSLVALLFIRFPVLIAPFIIGYLFARFLGERFCK